MSAPSETPPEGAARPSKAIIEAVARHEGIDVTAVEPPAYEPLYAALDPGALDDLFQECTTATSASLEYAGYDVTVSGDGWVEVTDPSTGDTVTRRFRD